MKEQSLDGKVPSIWMKFGGVVAPMEVFHQYKFKAKIQNTAYFTGAWNFGVFAFFEQSAFTKRIITFLLDEISTNAQRVICPHNWPHNLCTFT